MQKSVYDATDNAEQYLWCQWYDLCQKHVFGWYENKNKIDTL